MANNKMTWERWQSLTPEQREWEHFSYHERLERRLQAIESGKWKKTIGQMVSSFLGGVVFWATILIFFKNVSKIFGV